MARSSISQYGNEEVIAVNQDPLGIPGQRIAGHDLSFPCTTPPSDVPYTIVALPCDMADKSQEWVSKPVSGGPSGAFTLSAAFGTDTVTMVNWQCNTKSGGQVYGVTSGQQACGASGSSWSFGAEEALVSAAGPLCAETPSWPSYGPNVLLNGCNAKNQAQHWAYLPDGRIKLDVPQVRTYVSGTGGISMEWQ